MNDPLVKKIDMHVHASGVRGYTPKDIIVQRRVDAAKKAGLHGIVVIGWTYKESEPWMNYASTEFLVLRGVECSAFYMDELYHVLVYGVDQEYDYFARSFYNNHPRLTHLINEAGKKSWKLVPAHAFINRGMGLMMEQNPGLLKYFFAIEINGTCGLENNLQASDLARDHNIPIIAGSDAKASGQPGLFYTMFPEWVIDNDTLIFAVKTRMLDPVGWYKVNGQKK